MMEKKVIKEKKITALLLLLIEKKVLRAFEEKESNKHFSSLNLTEK